MGCTHKWEREIWGIHCVECHQYFHWEYLRYCESIYGGEWAALFDIPASIRPYSPPPLALIIELPVPAAAPPAAPIIVRPPLIVRPVIPAPAAVEPPKPKPPKPPKPAAPRELVVAHEAAAPHTRFRVCNLFERDRQSGLATLEAEKFDRLVEARFPYMSFSEMEHTPISPYDFGSRTWDDRRRRQQWGSSATT
jgi:hypothetical protein